MWKILLYDFAGKGSTSLLPQFGLFDETFFPEEDETDEGEETFEMQMFHHPTVDVDMSNGQALPPLSGQPMPNQDGRGRGRRDQLPNNNSISASMPMPDAPPFAETATAASWPMPGNTSVMDMTYDPFFQFQDPGSPFFGTWEVGNL